MPEHACKTCAHWEPLPIMVEGLCARHRNATRDGSEMRTPADFGSKCSGWEATDE